MSSSDTSGAPAEATATPPAPDAAFPTFGSTRGSGLARGKRPSVAAASAAPAPSDYKPTAIEVVNAPREYTNPFAPVDSSTAETVPATPSPAAETLPVIETVARPEPVERAAAPVAAAATPVAEEPAELNILPPAEQRSTPAQTWESEGFTPPREPRRERAPRDEQPEEVDIASIPPQFLYVREGVKFVPTPRNWGGAPRERRNRDESAPRSSESPRASASTPAPSAPAKSGGFLGWLKGLFGGSASEPVAARVDSSGESHHDGAHRRHRSGRGGRGGEGGGQRRHRGGRGRGRPYGGESEGTRSSGSL